MKISKPWIFLIPVVMAACAPSQPESNSGTDSPSEITTKDSVTPTPVEQQVETVQKPLVDQPIQQEGSTEVEIVNNAFAVDPFQEPLFDLLKSIDDFEIEKKAQENVEMENVVDTLVQVTFNDSKILYVQSHDISAAFILSAKINCNDVLFKDGISVGMSADDFAARFTQLKGKEDYKMVTIVNDSHTYAVQCMFENNKLSEISFDGSDY